MTDWSKAGKKAWETRRARAKKRSDAAIKAWETRKSNEVSERQSKAAYKAWETRRAEVA